MEKDNAAPPFDTVDSGMDLVSKHVACLPLVMSCIGLLVGDFGSGLHVNLFALSKKCERVLCFDCQILG